MNVFHYSFEGIPDRYIIVPERSMSVSDSFRPFVIFLERPGIVNSQGSWAVYISWNVSRWLYDIEQYERSETFAGKHVHASKNEWSFVFSILTKHISKEIDAIKI